MSSPYILPEGNVQIAFSGGRTSAYMLRQIIDANDGLPERCKVVFANTGREMPQTLDFVVEVGDRWGVPIAWVEYRNNEGKHDFTQVNHNSASRDGEPLVQLMDYFGFPPNRAARFCSHEGKTRTAKRYCMSMGWRHWTTAVGIRADEEERAVKSQPRERYGVWYPLLNAEVDKDLISAFWRHQPFDLKLPNVDGVAALGNCDGCFLKSEQKRAMLARDFPDRAQWWADHEARFGRTFHKNQSWADLQHMVASKGQRAFATEGYLCQVDDGECTGIPDSADLNAWMTAA